MFHSVRSRLAFWYATLLLAGLLVFALWMWVSVSRYLANSADDRVNRRIQGLTTAVEEESNESVNSLREELREFGLETPEGELSAVRGRGGRDLLHPVGIDETRLWKAPANHIGNIYDRGQRYRALRAHILVKGEEYDLAAATSTAEADGFLAQFGYLMLGAAPLLALVAFGGGYWMSRRALAPVDELTSAAHRISVDNLGERLPVRHTGDELERLGNTWNEMLARIDSAVERMRRFTADASHELRTPVSVIRTTAELALRRERSAEEYRQALQSIQREAEWMTQLAEDLLLLARSDAGTLALRREPIDLEQLAREAVDEAGLIAEARGISLRLRHDATAHVLGDRAASRRLLNILLDNALQYTPQEGSVTVETMLDGIAVRNTGAGIEPQDFPHIFERFYRGDPARTRQNGAGLGLAIAKSLAEAQDAEINVLSGKGEGAVFLVRFRTAAAREDARL